MDKELEGRGREMLRKSNISIYTTYFAMLIAIIGFPILAVISFKNGKVVNGMFCILFIYFFPKAVLGSMFYWSKSVMKGNLSGILYTLFSSTIRKYSLLPMPVNPIFDWFLLVISLVLVVNALNL